MNSNHSLSNTSRHEGCSVPGALSVSAFVRDAASIVHGPSGCAHQTSSLFHSTMMAKDCFNIPDIYSSCLSDREIIFGGEDMLRQTIREILPSGPSAIFIIGTCVSGTIGDDIDSICNEDWGIPVININTDGFLGGSFESGFNNALMAATKLIPTGKCEEKTLTANIIGEKNLEFEAEENYSEVRRLLKLLGADINIRFVSNVSVDEIGNFGRASVNIFREDPSGILTRFFAEKMKMPSIGSFPSGTGDTLGFLKNAGQLLNLPWEESVAVEREFQEEVFDEFADLRDERIAFDSFGFQNAEMPFFIEIAEKAGIRIDPEGTVIPVPFTSPIGTTGIRRLLREWRRFLNG